MDNMSMLIAEPTANKTRSNLVKIGRKLKQLLI